jgi:hypothetical protein
MNARTVILVVATAIGLGACAARQDHTRLLQGIPTSELTLTPQHTRAPELTLRLPRGFTYDWTAEADYDAFIIYNPSDTGDYQRGMLVINVAPSPVRHIPDSIDAHHVRAAVLGKTIEWRGISEREVNGLEIHKREAIVRDLFPLYKHPKSGQDLVLQAFVVGTDSVLVGRLMGSAESITTKNARPDT